MREKLEKLNEYITRERAYRHSLNMFYWDLETQASKDSIDEISNTNEILTKLSYDNYVNNEFKTLLYSIDEKQLDEINLKIVQRLKKDVFETMIKIPKEEYSKYNALLSKSQSAWSEAKNKSDYNIFKEYLGKIIEIKKQFIKYRGYENHPYDVFLDDFEPTLTVAKADKFFEVVKEKLVPFALEILNKNNDKIEKLKEKISQKVDKEKQQKLSYELSTILGFDFNKGVLSESEHPFTLAMNNKDVRFTTHYYEDDIFSNIYSIAHEIGHAIYEQQIDDNIDKTTVLAGGASMGIHEAQSRFSENMIAKNILFMPTIKKLLEKHYNLFLTNDEIYLLVNEVKKQYIRIEADELTYPIHVMIRYEIEKEIFNNLDEKVDLDKLRDMWNDMYEKYLGIRPRNDKEGILQDSHWSGGAFGYFPSYAIGSAYAAQMYQGLLKNVDIETIFEKEEFYKVNDFLKDTIHKYGALKEPEFLIESCSNEKFNPNYYIDYLIEKFSKIYS